MNSIKGKISVKVNKNMTVEKALRKLGKILDSEGVMANLRNRRFFEKPCVKKAKKSAKARARARKERKS